MVTALALVFGVLLLSGAVAGFVIVPEHQPGTEVIAGPPSDYRTGDTCANYTLQDQCEPQETIRWALRGPSTTGLGSARGPR